MSHLPVTTLPPTATPPERSPVSESTYEATLPHPPENNGTTTKDVPVITTLQATINAVKERGRKKSITDLGAEGNEMKKEGEKRVMGERRLLIYL